MKQLIIPTVIAVILHAVVLLVDFNKDDKPSVIKPKIRFMSMNLSVKQSIVEKKQKAESPPEKKKKPVVKNVVKKKKPVKKKEPVIKPPKTIAETKPPDADPPKKEVTEVKKEPAEDKTEPSEGATSVIREAFPLYIYNPSPSYPRTARLRGWQGVVQLEVLVDRDGNVKALEVLKSSGYSLLDKSALKTVKNWRFEPGKKGEKTIEMSVIVPIRFRLDHA